MVMYRMGAAKQSGWDGATFSGARSGARSGTAPPSLTLTKTTTEGGQPALCLHLAGDDNNEVNNSDNNPIACNNRINRGSHGPRAPQSQTATAVTLACRGFAGAIRKCTNTRTFKHHQCANVRVFVLG